MSKAQGSQAFMQKYSLKTHLQQAPTKTFAKRRSLELTCCCQNEHKHNEKSSFFLVFPQKLSGSVSCQNLHKIRR